MLYNKTIKEVFFRSSKFLTLCGNNVVILNSTKFQFVEHEVEFVGFFITSSGVRPTRSFVKSITNFPTPTSLSHVRSWLRAVQQVA